MKKLLWLDDMRNPFNNTEWKMMIQYLKEEYLEIEDETCDVYWAKTQSEFENYIKENGLPDLISFDNDLGIGNGEGYDCAKWLVEYCMKHDSDVPAFNVHSSNPAAKENIMSYLNGYHKFFYNS